MTAHDAYRNAKAADDAFQAALEMEFGADACNRRYTAEGWTDAIWQAHAKFLGACDALQKANA